MKRILIICDAFDERGGVERIVSLLSNHYALDNSVRLAVRFSPEKGMPYSLKESVNFISSGIKNTASSIFFKKLFKHLKYGFWIRGVIKEFKPDVILCNGAGLSVLTIAASPRKFKKRMILCDHNKFESASFVTGLLRGFFYRGVKHIISLTQEDLTKYGRIGNASCIYNPVIPAECHLYSKLTEKVVLGIGRLHVQKGFDILINAWAIVVKHHPDWLLKIVGDGVEKNNLEKQILNLNIQSNVLIEPSTTDIYQKFSEASLYVLSSRYEGFSLVMIEALSAGLPVIAFDCKTGPKEVLCSGGGFLVPAENYDELARKIIEYIESPATWSELSTQAVETSRKFSLEKYLKEMDKIVLD